VAITGTGYDVITMREACQPAQGYGGEDLRFTDLGSVKGCRMHASERTIVNVRSRVGVTGGSDTGAPSLKRPRAKGKNARRKARRYGRSYS
jgi:hypothetical protein